MTETGIDYMSVSISDISIPRGRLLVVENGVEIEIIKRDGTTETPTIDSAASCGQENDHRRMKP